MEVLILLLICLFLLAVVPLACRRTRSTDYPSSCAANLARIGKAMMIYANDYDDELPRSGGRNSEWALRIPSWTAANRFHAYGLSANGAGGFGSISSSFYLLVKYANIAPRSFLCEGDVGTSEFRQADHGYGNKDDTDLWDFGPKPTEHCSFSYHMPFSKYALKTSSRPGMAVAADRNPYIESPMAKPKDISLFAVDGDREQVKLGNAVQHDEEGQNVLFLDLHIIFQKAPYCGVVSDNIYTFWDGGDIRRGAQPVLGSKPQDRTDSLLVHDGRGGRSRGARTPKGRACFLADTPVWIDGLLVPISKVVAGQTIRRSHRTMPGSRPDRIEKVQEHTGTFECRDIILENGNRIGVVGAHCFMLASGEWIAAQNLTSGLSLRTLQGTVRIRSVTVRVVPYKGKVYNLKIRGADKYVVGRDAVIVRDY
jgi:hypothetical protein